MRRQVFNIVSALSLVLLAAAPTARAGQAEGYRELQPIYDEASSYPRGVELADGTLLVTFDHRIPGGRAIACVRSTDGGKTWGDYGRIAEDAGRVDVANAFPWQLADGTISHFRRMRMCAIKKRMSEPIQRWPATGTSDTPA